MERPLTENIRLEGEPAGLAEYERAGGYQALRQAVGRLTPAAVRAAVAESGLRGRGGAGFPTGKKWGFVPTGPGAARPKYLVVNGDEIEPGTFKDRRLMEGDPHGLVESAIIAAYAIEAETAYIFVRGEYRTAAARLARAVAEARAAGYVGRKVAGTDYSLEMYVHVSAGRYMCGEEEGLLNALEGKRPTPRAKPPHPPVVGLWGSGTSWGGGRPGFAVWGAGRRAGRNCTGRAGTCGGRDCGNCRWGRRRARLSRSTPGGCGTGGSCAGFCRAGRRRIF